KDWQTLASTVERIPEGLFPAEDTNEWQLLGTAGSDAQSGTLEGIQSAISTAERIADQTRPLYTVAQELIQGWRTEETALTQLAKARQMAESGTVEDLTTAIAEAKLVPDSNPRYQDALRDINNWTKQIQIYEDKPVLAKAKELADSGNVGDLQQAIDQASSISRDRALYSEARKEIQGWQSTVETQEDQPILDQANALGNNQDYQSAINTASQIRSGRALYPEARKKIGRWQSEIQAQKNLQKAYAIAANRTPESLTSAIQLVNQIPSYTEASSQRLQALNTWSYQLLSIAQEKASVSSFSEAIRLARLIPKDSAAYSTSRDLISDWRRLLAPPAPVAPPEPTLESSPSDVDSSNPSL
ncbi:MAG: chromosome segregation ATPase, partial [Snowella sp.]